MVECGAGGRVRGGRRPITVTTVCVRGAAGVVYCKPVAVEYFTVVKFFLPT